jgi:hypothetical protein
MKRLEFHVPTVIALGGDLCNGHSGSDESTIFLVMIPNILSSAIFNSLYTGQISSHIFIRLFH